MIRLFLLVMLAVPGWPQKLSWSQSVSGILPPGIAADPSGSVYIANQVSGKAPLPHAGEVFGPAGESVVQLSRFDRDGVRAWTVYLGGAEAQGVAAVATGPAGDVYVVGWTESGNFPIDPPSPLPRGMGRDIFVARFTRDGGLVFSGAFGGERKDTAAGAAVDGEGNVYIVSVTESDSFPVLEPRLAERTSGTAVFLTKISAGGDKLVYSTPIAAAESGFLEIDVDRHGAAYVAGVDSLLRNSLTKINPAGNDIVFHTQLPRSTSAVRAFPDGRVAVCDGENVHKFDADGANFDTIETGVWCTSLADTNGVVFGAGVAAHLLLPHAAFQPLRGSGSNAAVFRVDEANRVAMRSYLGGSGTDSARAVAAGGDGSFYAAGTTSSPDFPGMAGGDVKNRLFLAKLIEAPPPIPIQFRSNPAGLKMIVDDIPFDPNGTLWWQPGVNHTIEAATPQLLSNSGYVFAGWNHGGEASQTVATPQEATEFVAVWEGRTCAASVFPPSASVPATGGLASFLVTLVPACPLSVEPLRGPQFWSTFPRPIPTGTQWLHIATSPSRQPRLADVTIAGVDTTINQDPSAPLIHLPPSGQPVAVGDVVVRWSPEVNAIGYELRVLNESLREVQRRFVENGYAADLSLTPGLYVLKLRSCSGPLSSGECTGFATRAFEVR